MSRVIRVMSFNVRYGTAEDGPDSWSHRCGLVRDTIAQAAPHVLGTQEALDFQVDYLQQQLDGYQVVGVGREDGARRGEFAAVFFRTERFTLADHGHFWLSETPDVPGSRRWAASQTRTLTWCCLEDRMLAEPEVAPTFMVFNTHFDPRSERARIESAALLRNRVEQSARVFPVIVTGDFNATEDKAVYGTLLRGDGSGLKLIDAYRAVYPRHDGEELTRHDFQPDCRGSRIDWILHSPHFKAKQAAILRNMFNGRYPSDHYAVTATLQMADARG